MNRTASQQAAIDSLNAIKLEMQSVEPIDLTMNSFSNQRHYTTYVLQGDRKTVLGVAKKLIESDTCTPNYEHMLIRMTEVKELKDKRLQVTLSKCHYAGD